MSDYKCQNCEHAKQLAKWESELSKVMPPDFKDWWQNSRDEWPEVARRTIEALKAREEEAWAMVARLSESQS